MGRRVGLGVQRRPSPRLLRRRLELRGLCLDLRREQLCDGTVRHLLARGRSRGEVVVEAASASSCVGLRQLGLRWRGCCCDGGRMWRLVLLLCLLLAGGVHGSGAAPSCRGLLLLQRLW